MKSQSLLTIVISICVASLAMSSHVAGAETILYFIEGSSSDWAGSFEVDSLDSSPNDFTAIQSISAAGAGSFEVIYYGSNSAGWMQWVGTAETFNFTSPELYAVIHPAESTWTDVLDTSFTLTDTNTFQGSATLTGTGGTITFKRAVIFEDGFESGTTDGWSPQH